MSNQEPPTGGTAGEHPHKPHHPHPHEHDMPTDCPDGYHYCRASFGGWIMCKNCPEPLEYETIPLAIPCGIEDPTTTIMNHLGLPASLHLELVHVLDLGHNGWIAFFRKATIYP